MRALRRPVMAAIIAVLEGIDVSDDNTLAVGDGTDPDHEVPYAVVSLIPGGDFEGPMDDLNADETLRIQITGVGGTREQATWVCDLARTYLARSNIDAQFIIAKANRQILTIDLDFTVDSHDERGLTEPVFSAADQYVISTTPT